MQMKQIQDFGKMFKITPRHTIRIVQELETKGLIKKDRIKGKRKRKGYIINEDNIETLSEVMSWTQKKISQFIDNWRKDYRDLLVIKPNDSKKLKENKKKMHKIMSWLQFRDMYHCIKWITEIEWALRTGSLGNGKGKRDLAEKNIRKLEEFIEEISKDLKERDEHIWKTVLSAGFTLRHYRIFFEDTPTTDINALL